MAVHLRLPEQSSEPLIIRPLLGGDRRVILEGGRSTVLLDHHPSGISAVRKLAQQAGEIDIASTEWPADLAKPCAEILGRTSLHPLQDAKVDVFDVHVGDPLPPAAGARHDVTATKGDMATIERERNRAALQQAIDLDR